MRIRCLAMCAALWCALLPSGAARAEPVVEPGEKVTLDFVDAPLSDVIHAMVQITGKRFVYDERLNGDITILSGQPVTLDEALRMFESALQLKGFTAVEGSTGELVIVPRGGARALPLEVLDSSSPAPAHDVFATRIIALQHAKADAIAPALRPLASAEASLSADPHSNSLIVSDTSAKIARMLQVVAAIDVPGAEEQIQVLALEHADAKQVADQLRDAFGRGAARADELAAAAAGAVPSPQSAPPAAGVAEATAPAAGAGSVTTAPRSLPEPRFVPDPRTNSILAIAPRVLMAHVERVVKLLDSARAQSGSLNIYRLKHASAEDVAKTLLALAPPSAAGVSTPGMYAPAGLDASGAAALGAAPVAGVWGSGADTGGGLLDGGVRITADAATNSLLIQASAAAYASWVRVIEQLDVRRPQVLIEALVLEARVSQGNSLGTNLLYNTLFGGGGRQRGAGFQSLPAGSMPGWTGAAQGSDASGALESAAVGAASALAPLFSSVLIGKTLTVPGRNGEQQVLPVIAAVVQATENDRDTNIISAPQILTADNAEAQIVVGENRGFPVSQLQAPDAIPGGPAFQTSTQIERRDVGITMRVTPQITEGDSVRMKIFSEISNVTRPNDPFGPTTSHRQIENTVYVKDGESVLIGGIIQDQLDTEANRVPLLGRIPLLGALFRSEAKDSAKTNLLLLLTPHVVREPADLEQLTLEGRERFRTSTADPDAEEERRRARAAGLDLPVDPNPVRRELDTPSGRSPAQPPPKPREAALQQRAPAPSVLRGQYLLQLQPFDDAQQALAMLGVLQAAGYPCALVLEQQDGRVQQLIRVGPYPSEAEVLKVGGKIKGLTRLDAFVILGP